MTATQSEAAAMKHPALPSIADLGVQRTSTVHVGGSVSEDGVLMEQNRDSLRSTREYYGLSPSAGPSHSQSLFHTHHSRPISVRQSRSLSNATSRFSSSSRPSSPEVRRPPSGATVRTSSIPLPLHRGFLTPKKPKAAILLEERQRQASLHKAERQVQEQPPLDSAEADQPVQIIHAEQGERTFEGVGANAADGEPSTIGSKSTTNPPTPAYQDATYGRPAHTRASLAEASSQHATQVDQSSDDLVPTTDEGYFPNGEAEKGRDRDGKLFALRRQSHPERQAASRVRSRQSNLLKRRYQLFENPLSTFLFRGHVMTGGDNYFSVILVIMLLFGITGVWFGTTGVWYWQKAGAYGLARGGGIAIDIIFVYLFGLTFSSLLAASLREPGIIPRDLDPNPPMAQGETESWRQPLDREFAVKQGRVVVRYCETCRSYRPPRSSHCRLCGNCVDGIDHHCSYLHTCVGKRTYLAFLTLLASAGISAIYQVVFSALHFALLCHNDSIGFGTAIQQSPGAAVSFLLGLLVLPGIAFLQVYHFRLLLHNLTTVEQIRASASSNLLKATKRPDNPFAAESVMSNILISTLGRPQFPSWVQGWKVVQPERRLPNPALTEERWVKLGYDKGMR